MNAEEYPPQPSTEPESPEKPSDDATSRRDFLRQSAYAVYATPLITALLVERASAGKSTGCANSTNTNVCE